MDQLIATAKTHLATVDQLQYLEMVDADTLRPAESPLRRTAALRAAAYLGSIRLINNVVLSLPAPLRDANDSVRSQYQSL